MKKIIQYLAIAICAVFAVSCGDDYLKVSHYGLVSPDGIYQDADNVYGGLVGIYSTFYKDYNGAWPHPVICNSPSLDMQNEGWDAEMTTHSWGVEAKSGFFEMSPIFNPFLHEYQNGNDLYRFKTPWGKTGNANVDATASIPQLSTSGRTFDFYQANGTMDRQNGIVQSREIDKGLHWESSVQTNVGLDMAFWKNSLPFSRSVARSSSRSSASGMTSAA